MKRVIIVHGYTGNPSKNWFPWLKSELEKLGVSVEVPTMPNTNSPVLNEWLPYLQETVGAPDKNTFFVGHSLGCPTILRYLESVEEGHEVGGALLVAGFAEPLPQLPEIDSFTKESWNDEKITTATSQLGLINSDDDPAVPLINGEHMRDRFGAKLTIVHNAGHINEKSGYTEVPFVLASLKQMLDL